MSAILNTILGSLRDFAHAVHDINQKYKHPRIQMTRMVSLSLLMLRLYLISMVAILLYKFITLMVQ